LPLLHPPQLLLLTFFTVWHWLLQAPMELLLLLLLSAVCCLLSKLC